MAARYPFNPPDRRLSISSPIRYSLPSIPLPRSSGSSSQSPPVRQLPNSEMPEEASTSAYSSLLLPLSLPPSLPPSLLAVRAWPSNRSTESLSWWVGAEFRRRRRPWRWRRHLQRPGRRDPRQRGPRQSSALNSALLTSTEYPTQSSSVDFSCSPSTKPPQSTRSCSPLSPRLSVYFPLTPFTVPHCLCQSTDT